MKLKTPNYKELNGKIVLLRLDLDDNIPKKNKGSVRFKAATKTLRLLQKAKAKTIVIAHKGRPNGIEKSLSLKPAANYLAKTTEKGALSFLGMQTIEQVKRKIDQMAKGDIIVLENLRFTEDETKNNNEFAKSLASLAEIFINDAFATMHRDHASITGVPKYIPSFAGPTVIQEIERLEPIKNPKKSPFIAVIGGAKISSKLHPLKALLKTADKVFAGSAIATALKAEETKETKELLESKNLILPKDILVKTKEGKYKTTTYEQIQESENAVDIGEKAIKQIQKEVRKAKLILWNGPLGLVEEKPSRLGSDAVAHIIAEVSRTKAYAVIGGGDTVDIPIELKLTKFIDHISTGGSSMLEYISGKKLPGLEILKK